MADRISSRINLFKNISLSRKLGLGFSIILVLLAVISLISFFTINTASNNFTSYRELARDTNLMGGVQANMLMVRMNVKDFIITGSEQDLKQYAEYLAKTGEFMDKAKKEIRNPERAALVKKADDALQDYQAGFKKIQTAREVRNNLVYNFLDVQGPIMENTLSQILESSEKDKDMTAAFFAALALKHLLLGRLYMAKFLDVNDQGHVDRVNEEFAKMQKNLDILDRELQNPARRKWLKEVITARTIYIENFNKLSRVIFDRNDVVTNTLDRLGPEIAEAVEDSKLSVKHEQDILGPRVQAENNRGILQITILAIIAIVSGILNAWFIIRSVLTQLGKDPREIADIARKLGTGDLSIEFDKENIRGVYGDFKTTVENLVDLITEIRLNSESVAASSEELSVISGQISEASDLTVERSNSVASAAEEMKANMNSVASAMEESTNSVDVVAAGAEEMSSSIDGIAKDMDAAMKDSENAVARSSEVTENVKALGKNAEEIGSVTETIAAISEKTDLLALNATIEAARAGEAGKGFAVVASEIKELANQAAVATADISKKLKEIQSSTEHAVEDVKGISEIILSLNESVITVRETMTQQSAATREITENISQASLGLKEINQNVSQASEAATQVASEISEVNNSANEMNHSTAQLNQSAEELSKMAAQLTMKMDQFTV